MEQVVPWARLVDWLRPFYPKGERRRARSDATIIAAPPSTKNKSKTRDREMHQTKRRLLLETPPSQTMPRSPNRRLPSLFGVSLTDCLARTFHSVRHASDADDRFSWSGVASW